MRLTEKFKQISGSKIKLKLKAQSSNGGKFFRTVPGSIQVTRSEIYNLVREREVEFVARREDEAIEDHELLLCLKHVETKTGEVNFLNRIIRGGGFIDYINSLEAKS